MKVFLIPIYTYAKLREGVGFEVIFAKLSIFKIF
jgi:hypothetical protein